VFQYKLFIFLVISILTISFSSLYAFNHNNSFAISKKKDNNNDKFNLNVHIDLNNIKQENPQLFKLLAFVNGDVQTKIVDLKKNATTTLKSNSIITVPFYFNKTNDVSKIHVGDEYFVCGYVLKKEKNNLTQIKSNNVNFSSSSNQPMLYDCNEAVIASNDKATPKIFSTLTKFEETSSVYQASNVKSSPPDSKDVKIILLNPVSAKNIKNLNDMKFTAMVKGEYQIKKINVKEELKKSKDKSMLNIPFTFNTNTEIGPIQIGDFFYGCLTAEGYSSLENSECEPRVIKHFDKPNKVPVAH
jgi:hypothetical protein